MVFGFIKNTLNKIYTTVTSPLHALFAKPIDKEALQELETILLSADTGVKTTRTLITAIQKAWTAGYIKEGHDLKSFLGQELEQLLATSIYKADNHIYLLVGINGSGKTTSAAKLAYYYKQLNKKVLLVAADTFRAAATHQLQQWATQLNVALVQGKENQDPASVVFAGIQQFKEQQYDILIIDTAGRLQAKINLMKELSKIKRIITQQLPDQSITTLLTIDAMLGQNSFEQAQLFHESTPIDGIILTKMDGTAKGGIVFAIVNQLHIPVAYISFGEQPDYFKLFSAHDYVHDLLN